MGRLYCNCLNTKIGHSNDLTNARIVRIEQLCSRVPEQLSGKELVEVEKDIGGIILEHPILSQTYAVGDWNVHHCSNCSTDVYLSHSVKHEKTYAFKNLINDPLLVDQSPHFSKVFGILLKSRIENDQDLFERGPRKRFSSMNYGKEDPILKLAHNRMKVYLNQQEELMEQRIKKYEEEQREEFAKLQKQAHEERSRLFVAVYKSRESGITEAMLEQSSAASLKTNSSVSKSNSIHPVTRGFDVQPKNTKITQDVNNKPQTQKSLEKSKKEPDSSLQSMLDDDDGLFTFDEELKQPSPEYQVKGSDSTPFGLSSDDDDDSSTDGSSFHDDSLIRRVPSSLPMALPNFMRLKEEDYCGSIDDQIDPSEVAKSIQQLALSVQDTGMFGALPKPRTNSRR